MSPDSRQARRISPRSFHGSANGNLLDRFVRGLGRKRMTDETCNTAAVGWERPRAAVPPTGRALLTRRCFQYYQFVQEETVGTGSYINAV